MAALALGAGVAVRRFPAPTGACRSQFALGGSSLAALRSPLAPSAYVTISMLWLLTLLAGEVRGRPARVVAFVAAWVAIMGPPPLEGPPEFVVGFLGQAVGIAVCLWAVIGPRPRAKAMQAPAVVAAG